MTGPRPGRGSGDRRSDSTSRRGRIALPNPRQGRSLWDPSRGTDTQVSQAEMTYPERTLLPPSARLGFNDSKPDRQRLLRRTRA